MVVEVGYAQAWDLEAHVPWRPISPGEARELDAAGLPYVVVYRAADREAPLEVRLVSWRDHYVGLWVYDAQGRRTYDLDMRLLDDPARLLRRYSVGWHYTGPQMAEFDETCPRITVELFPDGKGRRTEESRGNVGGAYVTVPDVSDDERWMDRPAFGEWPLLSAQAHGLTEPLVFEITEAADDSSRGLAPATCWRPPRPAQPGPISELFRPGARVTDGYHPEMKVVEPHRIGTLRVPSGHLAVSGPDINHGDGPRLTIPVAPGEYVLENEFFGFVTDGATGCFADAGAGEPLLAIFEKGLIQGDHDLATDVYEDISDSMYLLRTRERASGGELAAFATTGDGTYPVWVGRSEAGGVVGVVVLVEGPLQLLTESGVNTVA